MSSLALIVHPSAPKVEDGEDTGTPEDHGLCSDPVLKRFRTFEVENLQLVVEQTWTMAKEREWYVTSVPDKAGCSYCNMEGFKRCLGSEY